MLSIELRRRGSSDCDVGPSVVAERDDILADIDRMRGRLTVTARIGAIPTVVPFITIEFGRRDPAPSVRIEALSSREIARRLADFGVDAGLTNLDDEARPGSGSVGMYRALAEVAALLDLGSRIHGWWDAPGQASAGRADR